MPWERAVPLAELEGRTTVVKFGPRQIAIFLHDGEVYALDNRCPHEGYPLAEGTIDGDCLLTCNWHNWKFRLADGQCVLGGDDVRTYATRLDDGVVWINTDDPPREQLEARILSGLHTAFDERDFGRICREIARLEFNDLDPTVAIHKAIEWSHNRLEFGTTHAYAAAADWVMLADRFALAGDFEKRLVCLAESVDHMAFDALRQPDYPFPTASEDTPFDRVPFLAAVECENREAAGSMVARALDEGLHWPTLEEPFATAALDHYNDFGHSLIYVFKTRQLLEVVGDGLERFLLPALARHLCYTTREDLLPEFAEYRPTLNSLRQPKVAEPGGSTARDRPTVPFPASTREAMRWLAESLERYDASSVYDALLEALAKSLLHYDTGYQDAFDGPVNDNVGWLDFTHGVTFANAARNVAARHPHLCRQGLLQMALFVGRNRRYIDPEVDESAWRVEDDAAFFAAIEERLVDHGLRDPIFSAHLLKTTFAVRDELATASESCGRALLAGLNRFLHSPIKQKHARRLARQAIELVSRDFRK